MYVCKKVGAQRHAQILYQPKRRRIWLASRLSAHYSTGQSPFIILAWENPTQLDSLFIYWPPNLKVSSKFVSKWRIFHETQTLQSVYPQPWYCVSRFPWKSDKVFFVDDTVTRGDTVTREFCLLVVIAGRAVCRLLLFKVAILCFDVLKINLTWLLVFTGRCWPFHFVCSLRWLVIRYPSRNFHSAATHKTWRYYLLSTQVRILPCEGGRRKEDMSLAVNFASEGSGKNHCKTKVNYCQQQHDWCHSWFCNEKWERNGLHTKCVL